MPLRGAGFSDRSWNGLTLLGLALAIGIGASLIANRPAAAKDSAGFLPAFQQRYLAAAGTRIATCELCHDAGSFSRNPYGRDFAAAGYQAIEGVDSDGDGFTNLQEIQALSFPGNPNDKPVTQSTSTQPVSTQMAPNPTGDGRTLYEAHCANCHGHDGGNLVPPTQSAQELRDIINNGRGYSPPFAATVVSGEIEAIVQYLLGAPTPPSSSTTIPTTSSTASAVKMSGSEVWVKSCAGCHGASGGDLVGHNLTSSQLVSITTNGAGGMPGFASQLSKDQISAVSSYLAGKRASPSDPTTTTSSTLAGEADGQALYAAKCSSCHGADGSGGAGGPVTGLSLTRDDLVHVTTNGDGGMPAFGDSLTTTEIEGIADFIVALDSGDAAASSGDLVDLDGSAVFEQLCVACHGSDGLGGTADGISPSVLGATTVGDVVRFGMPGMPSFGDQLTVNQFFDLIDHTMTVGEIPIESTTSSTTDPDVDAAVEAATELFADQEVTSANSENSAITMILAMIGLLVLSAWFMAGRALLRS